MVSTSWPSEQLGEPDTETSADERKHLSDLYMVTLVNILNCRDF